MTGAKQIHDAEIFRTSPEYLPVIHRALAVFWRWIAETELQVLSKKIG